MHQKMKNAAFQKPCKLSFERVQSQKAALRAGRSSTLAAAMV